MKPKWILTLVLASAVPHPSIANPSQKPNILVIFTDDHGWADLGAQGVNQDIRTPHLDQLARDGVRFTRGYVTAPQCVPSRAGLIAGQHQNRFGVDDNLKGPLPLEVLTIPERLKTAGYVTGMSGKWHLDLVKSSSKGNGQREDARFLPHAHGFDEYWCGNLNRYHASHDLKGKALPNPPALVKDSRFRITVQTEAALGFLDRRAEKPDQSWFLYLPWFAPHVPLESPEPWFSKTPDHLPLKRRQAMAMIAAMDDGVAAIRHKIQAMGQERNTLIFFIGDNGAPLKSAAWDGSINLPMVGEKGMLTDGGVRVPFIATWPGTIPPGQTCDTPVSTLDVGATAVSLAGLPHDNALDGIDLIPQLTDKTLAPPSRSFHWRWRSQAAILEYPWKLIHQGNHSHYLFNADDPEDAERNRIKENPEIAKRLLERMNAWNSTLKIPGPPETSNPEDTIFFDTHVEKKLAQPPGPDPDLQGWKARGGTLKENNGTWTLEPSSGAARGFLYHSSIDLAGPIQLKIRVRSSMAGDGQASWRLKEQKDFIPAQSTTFHLSSSSKEFQTLILSLPASGRVVHLRLHFPKAAIVEFQSIEASALDP